MTGLVIISTGAWKHTEYFANITASSALEAKMAIESGIFKAGNYLTAVFLHHLLLKKDWVLLLVSVIRSLPYLYSLCFIYGHSVVFLWNRAAVYLFGEKAITPIYGSMYFCFRRWYS